MNVALITVSVISKKMATIERIVARRLNQKVKDVNF